MKRSYILLLGLLPLCAGCSDSDSPTSPQQETSANAESIPDTKASGEDSPENDSNTPTLSPADEGTKDAMTLYREAQALMKDGKLTTGYEICLLYTSPSPRDRG